LPLPLGPVSSTERPGATAKVSSRTSTSPSGLYSVQSSKRISRPSRNSGFAAGPAGSLCRRSRKKAFRGPPLALRASTLSSSSATRDVWPASVATRL